MKRGCIAIGDMTCDYCKNTIDHGQRYLLIAEDDVAETKKQRICVECCKKKKLASLVKEKGEMVLTFFAD